MPELLTNRDLRIRVLVEYPCVRCLSGKGDVLPGFEFSCVECDGKRRIVVATTLSSLRALLAEA